MISWLTTRPSGRAHTCEVDDGVTGWKLHAVEVPSENIHFDKILGLPALCNLIPLHGWGLDLFIEAKCLCCMTRAQKLGWKPDAHDLMRIRSAKEWREERKARRKATP